MHKLLIIGAGGHARVVADAARLTGRFDEIAFLGETATESGLVDGLALHTGALDPSRFGTRDWAVNVAIGDNRKRCALIADAERLGYNLATIIHPFSYVSASARIGAGSAVLAGAVVQAGAELDMGVIVNNRASVDHDCSIGTCAHVAPGAVLAGNVHVGARSFIGAGVAVRHQVRIGDDIVVGAGAAVVQDLVAPGTYVGVPARPLAATQGGSGS
jgi:sugar O-acyltransferase (sialic acid O-acetyltransferase NeuD family)